jgi:hypothetical protein
VLVAANLAIGLILLIVSIFRRTPLRWEVAIAGGGLAAMWFLVAAMSSAV